MEVFFGKKGQDLGKKGQDLGHTILQPRGL